MSSTISDMTLEELRELIRHEIADYQGVIQHRSFNPETAAKFHEWLKTNRLKRDPGMPSLEEMLREDRDR